MFLLLLTSKFLTVLFLQQCFSSSADAVAGCTYKRDMCDISPQRCLANYAKSLMCENLHLSVVRKSSGGVKLRAKTLDFKTYPKNLTVSVVRSIHGKLSKVEGCCNLKTDETCTLPSLHKGKYLLIAPMRDHHRGKNQLYCYHPIRHKGKRFVRPRWCEVDREPPCVYLRKGILHIKNSHTDILNWPVQSTDYCLFRATMSYGSAGLPLPDEIVDHVQGMTLSGDGDRSLDFEKKCVIQGGMSSNISHHLTTSDFRPDQTVCAFIKMKHYSDEWATHAVCVAGRPQERNHDDREKLVVVVTGFSSLIVFLLIARSIMLCKKYLKPFFPSYEDTLREGFVTKILDRQETKSTATSNNEPLSKAKAIEILPLLRSADRYTSSPRNKVCSSGKAIEEDVFVIIPEPMTELQKNVPDKMNAEQYGKMKETKVQKAGSEWSTPSDQDPETLRHGDYSPKKSVSQDDTSLCLGLLADDHNASSPKDDCADPMLDASSQYASKNAFFCESQSTRPSNYRL